MNSHRYCVLILILVIPSVTFAENPPWIMLEQGRAALEERDLTAALDYLLKAVEAQPDYPEAEYWLGRVYEAQGQLVAAEEQFRRAIGLAIYLRVPDERVLYIYSLAELLINQGLEREAETLLFEIANEEGYTTSETLALEHQYMKLITEDSLDDLVYLYRDELHKSLAARRILGEMAWNEGRYRSSLLHSTRVVLSLLSTASERLRERDREWRFDINLMEDLQHPERDVRYPGDVDGVADLIDIVYSKDFQLKKWMESAGFWPQLYLLSVSLYARGFPEKAASIWSLMSDFNPVTGNYTPREEAGQWGRLATKQLAEPFITHGTLAP